ncbi:uncharacterized protein LOC112083001 [Eutrema salsugineum]|uniref:uncharacterized protein LOC112083001 n=1 Tax=Eutrema salsugineum TaxID=72664 RepID=UPI000CED28A5|nr:uncharacterized protein LOC112083001 [Eutrema salsugineum]
MSESLRQRMQNINLGITDEPVALPSEIINHAVANNQFSLVVVPLNRRKQNLRAMISQMARVWGLDSATTGRMIGQNQIQFMFQSEETMNLVLCRTPWSFADWMVTVHRWSPNLPDDASKVIPFWIQIRGIPLQFLSRPTIAFIGDLFGQVVAVDFDESSTRVDFVRVRVLWNVDNPLRFQRNFQFEAGVNTVICFKYERLRNFCKRCGMLTHEKKECPLQMPGEDPFSESDGDDNDEDGGNDPNLGAGEAHKNPPSKTISDPLGGSASHEASGVNAGIVAVQPSEEVLSEEERRLQAIRKAKGKGHVDAAVERFEASAREGFNKRKRQEIEEMLQFPYQNGQADVCLVKKRACDDESQDSCWINQEIDRAAGGDVAVSLGYFNVICVPPLGRSGGLAVFWNDDVKVSSLYEDYRHELWERLERISTTRNGPWMLVGDFNEILSNEEKIGGQKLNFRALYGSDHRPVITHVAFVSNPGPRRFHFDKRLIQQKDFKDYVTRGWNSSSLSENKFITDQIRECRKSLALCRRNSKLSSAKKIESLQLELDHALQSTGSTRQRIPYIQKELVNAYRDEELYWKQKTRNAWLKEGDRNTRFYQVCKKARFSRNRIHTIHDDVGRQYKGDKEVGKHAEAFFKKIYSSSNHPVNAQIFEGFTSSVSDTVNSSLTKDFSDKEIFDAVCSIGADKGPGPDGFTARFYQECWDIVGKDVSKEVHRFFSTSEMKPGLNHTNICMIPKISKPVTLSDYRPIGLCNVIYKIISKLMVLRLKSCLNDIVSEEQSAFIPGRMASDNVLVANELMHSLKVRKRVSQTYMAIKTDVSKAYDRVEWGFLEATLRAFGFAETWIRWTMATVTTVSYSILINGSPQGLIVPERGLRQGDPLSPYLFILCADVLSHLVKSMTMKGKIKGIKIGNGVPPISHLLFADDSLFFCQANNRNCKALNHIFKLYEENSGQMINQSKSMITFGSRIPGNQQARLKNILGIQNQGGGGKYLGLPEQFGRKKTEMFKYITDAVKKRTSSWKSKFLSPAGKEVLLKSVAISMPVYSMSCFKIPLTVVNEITSILSRFWWEKNEEQRGISWVAWNKLQLTKKEGGLGFRDLAMCNDALLAKQAWRLFQYPDSLFARLFKAKYYRESTVLEARPQNQQSFGWSSILVGLELLKQGVRYNIGSGKDINVFSDNWLPCDFPRPASGEIVENLKVRDLITSTSVYRKWNEDLLDTLVVENDKEVIKNIFLAQEEEDDKLIWHYSKDGDYSVRSGYYLARRLADPNMNNVPPPHGDPILKDKIWKLNIVPKLKHFLWRIVSKALGTATRLQSRGIYIDPKCQRCGLQDETINHLLFECPVSNMMWRLANLPIPSILCPSPSCEENIRSLIDLQGDRTLTVEQSLIPLWLLWRIWKSRNNLIFNKQIPRPSQEVLFAISEVKQWVQATKECSLNTNSSIPPSSRDKSWSRPIPGFFKCNFDAVYNTTSRQASSGWIIRDDKGIAKYWGSMALGDTNSALEAEGKSLLAALQVSYSKLERGRQRFWDP